MAGDIKMSRSITEVTLPARMGRPEAPIRQRRSVNPKPPQHLPPSHQGGVPADSGHIRQLI